MTDKEKAIVMAHTGICMLTGEKYGVFHAYIEDIMGRPVYTHELATQSISDEIKEKSRDDFIKLCMEEQEPCDDAISRQAVLAETYNWSKDEFLRVTNPFDYLRKRILSLSSVNPQPKTGQYEKHIYHTDCIWYGNDSGCPVTCSQYRDGWNDAMDYIFKNGKGYQPYRHDG